MIVWGFWEYGEGGRWLYDLYQDKEEAKKAAEGRFGPLPLRKQPEWKASPGHGEGAVYLRNYPRCIVKPHTVKEFYENEIQL